MRRHSAQAEVCVQVFYMFGCFLTEHDLSIIYIFLVIFVALLHFYLLLFVCEAHSQKSLRSAARDILKQLCYVVFFVNLCYCHWVFVVAFCFCTEVSCQFPHSS